MKSDNMNSFSNASLFKKISFFLVGLPIICSALESSSDRKRAVEDYRLLAMGHNPLAALVIATRQSPSEISRRPMSVGTAADCEKKSWSSFLSKSTVTRNNSLHSVPSDFEHPIELESGIGQRAQSVPTVHIGQLIRQSSAPIPIARSSFGTSKGEEELSELEASEEERIAQLTSSIPKKLSVSRVTITNEPSHVPPLVSGNAPSGSDTPTDRVVPPGGLFLMDWSRAWQQPDRVKKQSDSKRNNEK